MDWNSDGKVDWKDYALHDSATSSAEKGNFSEESDGIGCLSLVVGCLGVFYVLSILIKLFS